MAKILIQEVSPIGCRRCTRIRAELEEIAAAMPDVGLESIDMTSEKGQSLVLKHGIMSSPGILLNGEFFCMGGIDKDVLVPKLQEIASQVVNTEVVS
jgi:alkyl hydroperoxide reductase subunit AhpF